ncbi:MAG: endonuclease III domain-containing protein [Methanoregulaceae archaeon]|nr:endonuclease III domain-containing protein [Methanoregulaceae archaeon]
MDQPSNKKLLKIYQSLFSEYGSRYWWPADSRLEVIIGAILAQNVAWKNVEIAIGNLKTEGLLNSEKLYRSDVGSIAPLIRSSRFYNQKAIKIKNFMDFFYNDYNGNLEKMSQEETLLLRNKLLKIKGLGEETVDSILLYACNKPIFVVDAYTKRIFSRYGLVEEIANYSDLQFFFTKNLPQDIALYNDFHAQIVHLGNLICKKHPECGNCPIRKVGKNILCQYYSINHAFEGKSSTIKLRASREDCVT